MDLKEVIGNNLYKYRKEAELSQLSLSLIIQMGQKTISRAENYSQNLSLETIERLCDGLNIPAYELFVPDDGIKFETLLTKKIFLIGVIKVLYKYYLLMTSIHNCEVSDEPYKTYGIGLEKHEDIKMIDISTDRQFVESIVSLFNELQLSPVHFFEAVEDAIAQESSQLSEIGRISIK